MRILITGGAGFIGSHIVDACLSADHEPFVIDDLSSGLRENLPPGVPLFVADICDGDRVAACFEEVRPDAVCHQAAQISVSRSVREPIFDAQVNLLGLLQICTNAVRCATPRIVFASSGGVLYGDVYSPAKEDVPANPISPYGIAKWASEQYLKFFAREHGVTAVALRYANVYGPRQNPHGEAGVVAIFTQRLLQGEPACINGDGKYDRDYVYGPDVAQANVLALTQPLSTGFHAFNIGTGNPTDVNRLAALVREEVIASFQREGRPCHYPELQSRPHRPGDLRSSILDASLAADSLGWQPRKPFDEGVRETVAWFVKQKSTSQL
ncbi:MAG TPA: NAD-dependent epimerase/dehydratase family protein [Planctomycetaceae bacterium]|nr:NAD-dependent epimerase/dehydratase family protein [Planctomycetaceae bacterium]